MQTQSEYEIFRDAVHKAAHRARWSVLVIPAEMADDLGGNGLQEIANKARCNVVTERASKFHSAKLYRPESSE